MSGILLIAVSLSQLVPRSDYRVEAAPVAAWGADVAVTSRKLPDLEKVATEIKALGRKSLAIATHRHWGFLTDDRAARRYANTLGVEISGTLGVLVHAVKRNSVTLSEANELLAQMIRRARYHAPISDISALLK